MADFIETIIVGGGQAGLALSYHLARLGCEHLKLPVTDADGYPIQRRGVTDYEGLYFLGMPWIHSRRSGILFGVGDDAAHLAAHIAPEKGSALRYTLPSNNCRELTQTADI